VEIVNVGSGTVKGIRQFFIRSARHYILQVKNPAAAAEDAPGGKGLLLLNSDGSVALKHNDDGITSIAGDLGDVKATLRSAIPLGWLLCNGQAVSRTTYADLFALLGTSFGVGDGSTTFNLPDIRGKTLIGADGATYILGGSYGSATVNLAHTHTVPNHDHELAHTHGIPDHYHSFFHTHGIPDHYHSFIHTHGISHDHTYSHTHGISHDHTYSHTHTTNIAHDHANSTTGDSSASESVQEGTSGSFKTVADHPHTHDFDTTSVGATNVTSANQSTTTTGSSSIANTASQSTSTTGSSSIANTASQSTSDTDTEIGVVTASQSTSDTDTETGVSTSSQSTTFTDTETGVVTGSTLSAVQSVLQPSFAVNYIIKY
jgi:hypothetical protein